MDIINDIEFNQAMERSVLLDKYNREIDRESAYEKLTEKLEQAAKEQKIPVEQKKPTGKPEPSLVETISKNTMVRQMGRTLVRELARGFLGVLGVSSRRR
jgi:hypothetical protein